jgi:hypothetical protein
LKDSVAATNAVEHPVDFLVANRLLRAGARRAGPELRLRNGVTLSAKLDDGLAQQSNTYAGKESFTILVAIGKCSACLAGASVRETSISYQHPQARVIYSRTHAAARDLMGLVGSGAVWPDAARRT